jgi:membrane-bound serine protease (ClpP class)
LESIENYEIIRIQENWSENLVRLLTNPTVSSLLMTFGTIGIIAELYSAGWGIGGTIGAICLVLALGAGYISKLATSSDLLIVVAGLLLLLIEAFFVAGFGIIGLLGVAILFYGFYLLLIPDIPLDYDTQQQAIDGFGWGVFIGIIGLIFLIRVILRSELFNKLVSLDSNKSNLKENYNNRSKVD